MTIEEYANVAHGFGLSLIPVTSVLEGHDMTFSGTLPEYFQAVKAMGATAVFVSTTDVSEALFIYQNLNDDDSDDGDENDEEENNGDSDHEEEIDLCTIEPKLLPFKEKQGKPGSFNFLAAVAPFSLKFRVSELWWEEFVDLWSHAREVIEDQRAAEIHEIEAAEEKKDEIVLAKLRKLITDRRFVSLPTQLAMRAYAIEQIPDLGDYTDEFIRSEIQAMVAKIRAQGLKGR